MLSSQHLHLLHDRQWRHRGGGRPYHPTTYIMSDSGDLLGPLLLLEAKEMAWRRCPLRRGGIRMFALRLNELRSIMPSCCMCLMPAIQQSTAGWEQQQLIGEVEVQGIGDSASAAGI